MRALHGSLCRSTQVVRLMWPCPDFVDTSISAIVRREIPNGKGSARLVPIIPHPLIEDRVARLLSSSSTVSLKDKTDLARS